MFPTLISFGKFALHTYGLMLALGFLLGIQIATRRAKKSGVEPKFISDLSVVIILAAIAGARGFYVLLNFEEFEGHLLSIINPVQSDGTLGIGGLVFIGGLIFATAAAMVYTRKKGHSILKIGDIMMPGVAFGMAVGRWGCFFNGCCYGLACSLPWALSFPKDSPAGYYQAVVHAAALHPSQIYMSLGGLLNGVLLLFLERFKRFEGQTFMLFFIFAAIDRSVVDFFRYYPASELHHGLTHNQWILLTSASIFAAIFVFKWIKSAPSSAPR